MSNTSETSDQAATGNDDVYNIPIDRNAARLHRMIHFFIVTISIAIGMFIFIILPIRLASHDLNPFGPSLTFGGKLLNAIGTGFCFFVLYGLALAAIYFLFAKWLIEWQIDALNYRIEGRTLRVDSGVFFLKRKGVPLDRITDFALVQGPLMRLLGIWALQVQTAGVGTPTPEATLIAIENPEKVRDELLRRRDVAAQGNRRDDC